MEWKLPEASGDDGNSFVANGVSIGDRHFDAD